MNIIHNQADLKFEVEGCEAVLAYRFDADNQVNFYLTYVSDENRGQGYAEALVRKGLAWAKEQQYQIKADCWYVGKFIR